MSECLDSRDLEERIEELESFDADDITESDAQELADLIQLREEIGDEWKHGVTLIPESDFEDYARQLAEDLGAVDSNARWPACHIDWEAAADSLKMDYTSVEFQGETYLYRA